MAAKYPKIKKGDVFGRLTALEDELGSRSQSAKILAKCDCGTEKHILVRALFPGHTVSCGCLKYPKIKKGDILGKLTALEDESGPRNNAARILTQCICGTEKRVLIRGVFAGDVVSCGCYMREIRKTAGCKNATHKQKGTPTHNSWSSMRGRCNNAKSDKSHRYGHRGISVCSRWESFENFLEDMGERPAGHTLDRIDNEKGYFPENCRWATQQQQMNNVSYNLWLEHQGKRLTQAQWARELKINYHVFAGRIKGGWSIDKILETPVRSRAVA